ncbi:energy-coupling factor transporter transmembrane component T [Virgibacillus kimchii]
MIRGIRSFHPFVLSVYYVFVIIGIMLYQHPVYLAAAVLLILFFHFMLDKGKRLKKWGWMIALMCTLIILLTPLFNRRGNHILFYFMDNQIMLEAVIQGIMIALTLAGILSVFVTFNIVLTADKFLFLFSKVFPQWALLTMLSMRFVPLLMRKIQDMQSIQQVKGLSLSQGSIRRRANNGMQLVQMLLTGALEDSIQAADSMSARGYGLQKRSNYQAYYMKRRDWSALCCLLFAGLFLFYGWTRGNGVLQLLPVLEPLALNGGDPFYFMIWLLFIGFPILAEGKEVLHWKLYQRRI